ncbi:30S ribosomal protein S18 [Chloroflexota bacterium]
MERRKSARPAEARSGVIRGGGRFAPRRRACPFCVDKGAVIDYKDSEKLRYFISDSGKVEPRRKTGACAKHQRVIAVAIKRARHLALLPYTAAHTYKVQALSKSD